MTTSDIVEAFRAWNESAEQKDGRFTDTTVHPAEVSADTFLDHLEGVMGD